MDIKYCKIEVFIPEDYLEKLTEKFRELDVGHIGNYDSCMSISRVTGRWRSLEGTHPYIGKTNELSEELELKIEATCKYEDVDKIVEGIKSIHPYEEPVINIIPLLKVGI